MPLPSKTIEAAEQVSKGADDLQGIAVILYFLA